MSLIKHQQWQKHRVTTKVLVHVVLSSNPWFLLDSRQFSLIMTHVFAEARQKWISWEASQNAGEAGCLPQALFSHCRNHDKSAFLCVILCQCRRETRQSGTIPFTLQCLIFVFQFNFLIVHTGVLVSFLNFMYFHKVVFSVCSCQWAFFGHTKSGTSYSIILHISPEVPFFLTHISRTQLFSLLLYTICFRGFFPKRNSPCKSP